MQGLDEAGERSGRVPVPTPSVPGAGEDNRPFGAIEETDHVAERVVVKTGRPIGPVSGRPTNRALLDHPRLDVPRNVEEHRSPPT